MRKEIIKYLSVSILIAAALTAPVAVGLAAMQTDNAQVADPVEDPERQRLTDAASDGYKNLKFIQYDGVTEEELYPAVIDVYGKVRAALASPEIGETDRTRFKGILLDLSDLLRKGSVFYSNRGNMEEMSRFASAYVDMRLDPDLRDLNFGNSDSSLYPSLVYCAASGAYNKGDYENAVKYLEEYLNTGANDRREQVSLFLGQACINAKCPERGVEKLTAAVEQYPANYNLLMLALQNCLDAGRNDLMQPMVTKGLALQPENEQLLNLQGRLFEDEGNFASAIDIYQRLYEMKPNSLPVNQHLALCYYNLGADYYNKALMEGDEKTSKRYSRQAQAYLSSAVSRLETVVENDPTNPKYLKALATTYGCLGNKDRLDGVNVRLQAIGMAPMAINGMPESITMNENTGATVTATKVPDFQEFARGYVEKELASWTKRGEFEKIEDYEKRVNQENVYQQYQMLCKKAETDYLKKYASRLRISDLTLEPYDVENESYRINSAMGPIVVKVPLKNKEAEAFKSNWNTIQLRNPKYFIKDNRVAIASVELVTSAGKSYRYDAAQAADYDFTDVTIDLQSYLNKGNVGRHTADNRSSGSKQKVLRAKSDVDENIPLTSRKADKTVALIIANEDYKQVTDVESALNDGETFSRYCTMTLGVPESQVMLYENVTYAEMMGALRKLRQLVDALGDNVDVIFYYAGHGFPDEGNKEAYLLPVDGDGFTTATSFPLKKLYSDLSSMGADNVMVFLDACFSGATREGGMLAEARGVALKPRVSEPRGNMFVLSAASDQETALPYREKNHGIFTYYLLKKLQDTKGNVTLKDLSAYVEEQVKKNSLTVNRKLQTPRTSVSGRMRDIWGDKKLRP
ncbi:MAG: caspase family protein [Muribaculaceae bacterium]|nr:caspase family protein [Muribaculaceae bacterium]